MPDRPSLTFVTRDLQDEPRAGAPIRTRALLEGLAASFDVTAITLTHEDGSTHPHVAPEALRSAFPGVEVVTVPGLTGTGKRRDQLLAAPRARSFEWGRYRTPQLIAAVRGEVARRRPAVLHFDDPGVAQAGPVRGPVNAFAPHNVEHRILAGTAAGAGGVRAAYARLEARKIAREERALWRAMDVCVAVSELDAEAMRAGGAREVLTAPNGTAPVEALPWPRRAAGEPLRLLFVGTGSYWPNEHGLRWVVDAVLPSLRSELAVTLEVVGDPPVAPPEAPEVTYTGSVPSVRPHYERAHVVVVPLHHGSGTRLKVVEAMAHGRPVVSTTLGAEGLPVRGGEHFVRADDPAAFSAALLDLGRRLEALDAGLAAMLTHARDAADGLRWPAIAGRLAADYLELAAREQPPAR